jgi:hypothetical protein
MLLSPNHKFSLWIALRLGASLVERALGASALYRAIMNALLAKRPFFSQLLASIAYADRLKDLESIPR